MNFKASEKVAIQAMAGGLIVSAGLYWIVPGLAIWLNLLIGFISAAGAYSSLLMDAANKKTIDEP